MATLNGNNVYLAFRGVDLSGYWTEQLDRSQTMNTQDLTAGAGATHVQRGIGLIDGSMSFSIVYDVDDLDDYLPALVMGSGVLDYGPEGRVAGKPRHSGEYILNDVTGPSPSIEKDKVMFELSFEQADTPTHEISNGDKW